MLDVPPVGRQSAVEIARPKKGLTRAGLLMEAARNPIRDSHKSLAMATVFQVDLPVEAPKVLDRLISVCIISVYDRY
jgi:hypothetical protein